MIDNLHHMHRRFAAGITRTALRHNPHLLAVNYFLSGSRDIDTEFPVVRLVYGSAKREALALQPDQITDRKAKDRADSDIEAI